MKKSPKQEAKELIECFLNYAKHRSGSRNICDLHQSIIDKGAKDLALLYLDKTRGMFREIASNDLLIRISEIEHEINKYKFDKQPKKNEDESDIRIDMSDFKGTYSISEAGEVAKKMAERIEQVKFKYKENKFDSWFEDFKKEFREQHGDWADRIVDKNVIKNNYYDKDLSLEYSVDLYYKEIMLSRK